MAQQGRALAAPVEDPGPVPSTQVRQFRAACDSNSRAFDTLFWVRRAPTLACVHSSIPNHLITFF